MKACSQYFYFRLQDASFIFDLLSTPGLASRDFFYLLCRKLPVVNEITLNFCRIIMLNFLSVFLSTVLSTYWPLTGQIMYHGISAAAVGPLFDVAFAKAFDAAISTDCNFQRYGRRTVRLYVSHFRASARWSLPTRPPEALLLRACCRSLVGCCRTGVPTYRSSAECRQKVAARIASPANLRPRQNPQCRDTSAPDQAAANRG